MTFPQPGFGQGIPLGLAGATTPSRYVGGTVSGAPVAGTFNTGDFVIDQTGLVWVCTNGGTPGTWNTWRNDPMLARTAVNFNQDTSSAGSAGTNMTVATQIFIKCPCPTGGPVNKLFYIVGGAGATLTNSFLSIYLASGTLNQQSADQSTNWSTGAVAGAWVTLNLTPFSIAPGPSAFFWVCFYVGTQVTGPQFQSGSASGDKAAGPVNNGGASAAIGTLALANTNTMPASIVPANIAAIPGGGFHYIVVGWQ